MRRYGVRSPPGPLSLEPDDPFLTPSHSAPEVPTLSYTDYSPDKLYVWSKDQHGKDKDVKVTLPSQVMYVIDAGLARGMLPYNTRQECIRDSVVHRLVFFGYNNLSDELKQKLRYAMLLAEVDEVEREIDYEQKIVDKLQGLCMRARTMDQRATVAKNIQRLLPEIKDTSLLMTLNQMLAALNL